jgi:hypothetical protein
MKIGSPQEPDLEIDEVSAWFGRVPRRHLSRRRNARPQSKRTRAAQKMRRA